MNEIKRNFGDRKEFANTDPKDPWNLHVSIVQAASPDAKEIDKNIFIKSYGGEKIELSLPMMESIVLWTKSSGDEMNKKELNEDFSKTKPDLHMHYVKTAVSHLMKINKAIKGFNDCYNCNMYGPMNSLTEARQKLIDEKKAYFDADEILQIVKARGRIPSPEENIAIIDEEKIEVKGD